jgi:hypothetical protein
MLAAPHVPIFQSESHDKNNSGYPSGDKENRKEMDGQG